MSMLQGFPLVSQLSEVTSDGRPSEDAQFECVPASIGAGILWYQGKHQWDEEVNPDLLKDKAYGEAWKNAGTAASAYVPFCQSIGFKLYPVNSNPADLVAKAHQYLAQQKPVIFTEPDPYVPSSYGWSHVCVFYADAPNSLTALDPYIGKPVTRSDGEWANLLLFNQIWILEEGPKIMVPQGWNDQNGVLTAPNGLHVKGGFRDYILSHGWDPNDWPLEEEMQMGSLEDSNPSLGAGAQQCFRMSMLGATASRGVFKEWLGQELVTQRANVAKYYQRWQDALKAQPPATDTTQLQAELTKYKTMAHQVALIVQGE